MHRIFHLAFLCFLLAATLSAQTTTLFWIKIDDSAGGHDSLVFGNNQFATYCTDTALGETPYPPCACPPAGLQSYFLSIPGRVNCWGAIGLSGKDLRNFSPTGVDTFSIQFVNIDSAAQVQAVNAVLSWPKPSYLRSRCDSLFIVDPTHSMLPEKVDMFANDGVLLRRVYDPTGPNTLAPVFRFFIYIYGVRGSRDSALDFYPLNIGDVHEFHYKHLLCRTSTAESFYCAERVSGDTLMPNGNTYKVIQSNIPPFFGSSGHFVRIDSVTANVYEYHTDFTPPQEILLDSLRATVNSSFITLRGLAHCYQLDSLNFLGIQTTSKDISVDGPQGGAYQLAYGLGRIRDIAWDPYGCNEFGDNYAIELVYAHIDGMDYGTFVGVRDEYEALPKTFDVYQNYPNPFNSNTTIRYVLPSSSSVILSVYDLLGQEITTLTNEFKQPGSYTATWNAEGIASGVYLYRLQAGSFVEVKKLILMR